MGELIRLEDKTAIDGNWQNLKSLVLNTVASPHTRRAYDHGLNDYRDWHAGTGGSSGPFFSKAAVNAWKSQLEARGLASSTIKPAWHPSPQSPTAIASRRTSTMRPAARAFSPPPAMAPR